MVPTRVLRAAFFVMLVLLPFLAYTKISAHPTSATSAFRLPIGAGLNVSVSQGNNDTLHDHVGKAKYAFDFTVGTTNFVVTASQGGIIIGADDSSTTGCAYISCWTQANYVVIADDDGTTATLYLHLLHNSLKVRPGMHVNQGEPLGLADTTGWATGPHLHFQVENIPNVPAQPKQSPGWWWTQSVPVSFSNPEVLSQDANGVPQEGQSFPVSNPTTPIVKTVPMPPTQTTCPASGTARAAVMRPLALGQNQNIVYIDNEAQTNGPDIGTIKRYDVTTKITTEIVKLHPPGSVISEAQVSADGQWILFVVDVFTSTDSLSEIQMVRMDGQGLQTLHCASRIPDGIIGDIQWSPDQKTVVFDQTTSFYLLDLTSGQLISQQSQGLNDKIYIPITWLDNTRVYADGFIPNKSLCNYILDIGKSSSKKIQNLQLTGNVCSDGDEGFYGAEEFRNQCNCTQSGTTGPSSITVQSTIDGSSKTIYSSRTLAITNLWVVSSTKLMLRIENSIGDNSQNGYWTINMDGTDLKKAISDSDLSQDIDPASRSRVRITGEQDQYPYWKNNSRDGSLYTVLASDVLDNGACSIYFGSLNGGSITRFASFTNCSPLIQDLISVSENLVGVIGWTTL
jgi:Peptidase family M23